MRQWTEFQKSCVQHIAGLLHGIRGLVKTLGDDALRHYCHHGCLDKSCIEGVKAAAFVQPDTEKKEDVADDSEDAAGESENGDEGPEDEDGGYQDEDEQYEDDSDEESLFVRR